MAGTGGRDVKAARKRIAEGYVSVAHGRDGGARLSHSQRLIFAAVMCRWASADEIQGFQTIHRLAKSRVSPCPHLPASVPGTPPHHLRTRPRARFTTFAPPTRFSKSILIWVKQRMPPSETDHPASSPRAGPQGARAEDTCTKRHGYYCAAAGCSILIQLTPKRTVSRFDSGSGELRNSAPKQFRGIPVVTAKRLARWITE